MNLLKSIPLLLILLMVACEETNVIYNEYPTSKVGAQEPIPIKMEKWFGGKTAAITVTYDNPADHKLDRRVQHLVKSRGFHLNYELVTHYFAIDNARKNFILDSVFSNDHFSYFGHGHKHHNHDTLSYEESFQSFSKCFVTMKDFGLTPISYAYPHGGGTKEQTRLALKNAGFLSARMYNYRDINNLKIMPFDQKSPADWYQLPTLVMEDLEFHKCEPCINNTNELIPHLDRALAEKDWLITTYHSIGNPEGWGYYDFKSFAKDVDAIMERDFWITSMDSVTSYVLIKNQTRVFATKETLNEKKLPRIKINFVQSLGPKSDRLLQVPLTVRFEAPQEWEHKRIKIYRNNEYQQSHFVKTNSIKIDLLPNGNPEYLLIPDS